jgi:hypothetical protein
MFASSELDYWRDDTAAQRRIVEEVYAGVKWDVPRVLNEMADFDDFYLDSISQVQMNGAYTKGRVALVGDSAYGNRWAASGPGSPWSARTSSRANSPSPAAITRWPSPATTRL